jgi:multidrug efflux pump subunit AcrA (membrane-fusion protein)
LKQEANTKRSFVRIIIIVIIAIFLIGAGVFVRLRILRRAGAQTDTVYTVREEIYRNIIEITGNIEAAQQQNIQAAGDGTVEAVYVKESDHVKAGQIFFQLDDSLERYNLANHDFQMNLERINGASGKLALMNEQRKVLLKAIENRRLEARFDGVIGKLALAEGDYAKAQDIFGYLIDREYLKATVEVVETDAVRLKAGQRVTLNFPAYPELEVEGMVLSYPAVGRIATRGATVLDTKIRIDNPPEEILPGYSFTGEIIGGEPERILTVEAAAVAYENGRAYVERISRANPQPRPGEGSGRGSPQARSSEEGGPAGGDRPAFARPVNGSPGSGEDQSAPARPVGDGPDSEGGGNRPVPARPVGDGPDSEGGGDRPVPARPAGDGPDSGDRSAPVRPEGGRPASGLPANGPGSNSDGNSSGKSRDAPPVEDGPPERVDVEAVSYGRNMVRILAGLEPGDRLKAQAQAAAGGFFPGRRGGTSIRIGR